MPRGALRFVGADRLPSRLSAFDIEHSFALSSDDVEAIRAKFRRDRWVAVALQLVFLRASGRSFDRYAVAPRTLLQSLGNRLGVSAPSIASLKTLYGRPKTLTEHQAWAREHLELKGYDEAAAALLGAALDSAASRAVSVDELVGIAEHWLFEEGISIPSDRALRDRGRAAFAKVEAAALATVKKAVAENQWKGLLQSIQARRPGPGKRTVVEWLRAAPAKHSPSTLSDALDKVRTLKKLGADAWDLSAIAPERLKSYGLLYSGRTPSDAKNLAIETQIVETVCFLKMRLLECTDEVLRLASRRSSDLVRRARAKALAASLASYPELRSCVVAVRNALDDEQLCAEEKVIKARAAIAPFLDNEPLTQAGRTRGALAADTGSVRALMRELVTLPFQGGESDIGWRQIRVLHALYEQKATELPAAVDAPIRKGWRDLTGAPDRARAMRAFEAAAMIALRTSLRRGSVWVDHSESFRDRESLLLPREQWQRDRAIHIGLLGQPAEPDAFLEPMTALLSASLAAVSEALAKGAIGIEDGVVRIPALEALDVEAEPVRTG